MAFSHIVYATLYLKPGAPDTVKHVRVPVHFTVAIGHYGKIQGYCSQGEGCVSYGCLSQKLSIM